MFAPWGHIDRTMRARLAAIRRFAAPKPGRVRLRTLVYIRWVAVGGQLAALVIVNFGLNYPLPMLACLATVAVSAAINTGITLLRPMSGTLSDRSAALWLAYDILQLSTLLYLTGGLQNPFAVIILASVVVSASVLSRISTLSLGLLVAVCISVLAFRHEPLPGPPPLLDLPVFYVLGVWQALVIGGLFIAAFVGSVAEEGRRMQDALNAAQVALEHEQRLSSLGGLAAAAAHELGTPLATIAVTARELSHDLPPGSPMTDDVELILEQTARCREILMELSRKPETEGGEPYTRLALGAMLDEAARPYLTDSVNLTRDFRAVSEAPGSPEPVLTRSPEFLRAVGTLIQNAIQFADSEVILRARWDAGTVTVEIIDDGSGFSAHLLDRLGEPYVSTRAGADGEGEHMGLGVFIAQNLLNRTGATLSFANQDWWDWWGAGAIVRIAWPRRELEHSISETGRVGEHAGD